MPEVAGSGYDGATVRNLLDMRSGVAFSEAYTDPHAEVRVIERHIGWRPDSEDENSGLYAYLATLSSQGPHGGPFVYRSADTDMLGWVCERAAGVRMAELMSTLIWAPMGAEFDAEITCDGSVPRSTTVESALRLGTWPASATVASRRRVGHRAVVPESWLPGRHIDPDVRGAFAASDSEPFLPGGWYRNQFWFVPGRSGDI